MDVLKSPVINEPKLASDIEAKHCNTTETSTGQTSGQMMSEVQQPQLTTRYTELHTLQQALQDSRELRIKDRQLLDSQRQIEQLTHQVKKKNLQLENIGKDLLQHEQTIREFQAANDQLKWQLQLVQQVEEKERTTEEREKEVRELIKQLLVMQQKAIRDMRWQKASKAPQKMIRGSAASDSNLAYFDYYESTIVHSAYDSNTQEWHQLPAIPNTCFEFTLVVVHSY